MPRIPILQIREVRQREFLQLSQARAAGMGVEAPYSVCHCAVGKTVEPYIWETIELEPKSGVPNQKSHVLSATFTSERRLAGTGPIGSFGKVNPEGITLAR